WPGDRHGTKGTGQITTTSYAIPEGSTGFWLERLMQNRIATHGPFRRFDEQVVRFQDPDGLVCELVSRPSDATTAGKNGTIEQTQSIIGFAGVTLSSRQPERT